LPLEKMITHKFKLDEVREAIKNVEEKNGIKTIIKPWEK